MLIKPFEPLQDRRGLGYINVQTDIAYVPAYAESRGRLVVSKKFLLNNFSSKKSNTFVKVTYVMWHNCTVPIESNTELKNTIIGDLFLRYTVTGLYDSEEKHCFGNLIYDTTTQSQTITSVFDVTQSTKFVELAGLKPEEIDEITRNAYFVEILKDDPNGEIEFYLLRGQTKTFQPMSGYLMRKVRNINEFIQDANVHFTGYSGEALNAIDKFSDQNVQQIAKQSVWMNDGMGPYNDSLLEVQIKKEICDRLLSDLTKANIMSLADEVSLMYNNGRVTIVNIKYPFNKVVVDHLERIKDVYEREVMTAIKPAINTLGELMFIAQISDTVSIGSVTLRTGENFKSVSFMDQTIDGYIFDNCKSKRYRKKHQSPLEIEYERIAENFDEPF